MALMIKPEPFTQDFNRLMNTFFGPSAEAAPQRWVPPMDLVEVDDHFLLKADLPGMAEGDVSIEIQDNMLTLAGERRAEDEQRQRGWYRVERSFGRFSRSLTLPEGVNADAVEATFNRGVLEVRIPKPEQRQPRRVTIQAQDEPAAGAGQAPTLEGSASER